MAFNQDRCPLCKRKLEKNGGRKICPVCRIEIKGDTFRHMPADRIYGAKRIRK